MPDDHPPLPVGVEQKHTIWGLLPWVCAWPFTYLAVWAWSSHVTSVFSYGKWAMMIIPPSRLHMCLQRASGPERAFWVPESETNMNYSATWEKAIFCLEVMATIPKAKILIQAKLHLFWTLTQNSDWADASVFWAPIRAKDYWLRLLPSSALPVSLSFSTTSPLKSHCKESCKGSWSLLSFTVSSVTTSRCYGYLS